MNEQQPTIEKASDTAIAVVTRQVIEISDLHALKDDCQRQIDQINANKAEQIKPLQDKIDDIDAHLAKAADLGVAIN